MYIIVSPLVSCTHWTMHANQAWFIAANQACRATAGCVFSSSVPPGMDHCWIHPHCSRPGNHLEQWTGILCKMKYEISIVFFNCLSTIFKTEPVFSKHYPQLAQPHTQSAEHLRPFAKWNTRQTIHYTHLSPITIFYTIFCDHTKHTCFKCLHSVWTSYTLLLLTLLIIPLLSG